MTRWTVEDHLHLQVSNFEAEDEYTLIYEYF